MNAPVRPTDFIGELCVALAHRWEPERNFMVLTAYFDESGTHEGSGLAGMAGFVGDARQWRKFEKRAGRLFKRFGVDVFHTIDVRRTDKDFEGWKVDQKIEFLDEFQHIINETLESGVAAFISDDDYKYFSNLEWPRKARKDSKYTVLFRACLAQIVDVVGNIPNVFEPKLHVVLEEGHKNAPDAVRIYKWAQERLRHQNLPHYGLAGLTFEGKGDSLPLAAADLFAYTAWGAEVGQKIIGVARKPIKSHDSYRGNYFRIMLDRESLESLHAQTVDIANGAFAFSRQRP